MATEQRRTRAAAGTTRRAKAAPKADVIDIDFEGYEPPRADYMGEDPRPGVYRFALRGVSRHTSDNSGNDSIRWIFICEDEPYAGWAAFVYTGLPDSDNFFRTQHIVRALQGGNTKKVQLNLDDPEKFLAACKVVLGRVKGEEYNGEIRGKLTTVAPDDGSVKSTAPDYEDDEDLEDEDEYEDDIDDDADEEVDDEDDDDAEDDEEEDDEDDEDEDAEDEDDEEDDEEEEEDEPEPEPAPRRRRASKAAPAKAATKAAPAKKVAPRQRRAR